MQPPRGLSAQEAALWARVADTVRPLHPVRGTVSAVQEAAGSVPTMRLPEPVPRPLKARTNTTATQAVPSRLTPSPGRPLDRHGLDSSWERKLARAAIQPDFTLDLHGHSLEAAHQRLDQGLALAAAQGARLVLVVTGRPRPVDAADRSSQRGAIRAKLIDWLASGSHASRIAAVRAAHPRHGGIGAVYVVLRRER